MKRIQLVIPYVSLSFRSFASMRDPSRPMAPLPR